MRRRLGDAHPLQHLDGDVDGFRPALALVRDQHFGQLIAAPAYRD